MSRRPYKSAAARRKAAQDRLGLALIAACALGWSLMLFGAYKIDQAHGISVSQSLHNWGF